MPEEQEQGGDSLKIRDHGNNITILSHTDSVHKQLTTQLQEYEAKVQCVLNFAFNRQTSS
jgi:hypothetical protein